MTNPKPETASSKSTNGRTIGPVTGAATGGAALATLIAWVAELLGNPLPDRVEGALVVLLVIIGGWLVKPGTGARRA